MSNTHYCAEELIFCPGCCLTAAEALELAVHDKVDILRCGDTLAINELPGLQLVDVGGFHEELEGAEG